MKEVFNKHNALQDPIAAVMIPIWDRVQNRVQDQIYKRIWKQVENDMDGQVWDQVREELL